MNRRWSQNEIEFLQENWGERKVHCIAKVLKRSDYAIILKAQKIGLQGCYKSNEYLCAYDVAKILGVDIHTVINYWIGKCGLKATKKALIQFESWKITQKNLLSWLKNNQDKFDSRKIELYGLGVEPKWLKEKRKKDIEIPKRRFQKWTKVEDEKLIIYREMGKKQREIAEILNRSLHAVERRLTRLKEKGIIKIDRNKIYIHEGKKVSF